MIDVSKIDTKAMIDLAGKLIDEGCKSDRIFLEVIPSNKIAEKSPIRVDNVATLVGSKWRIKTNSFEGEVSFEHLLVLVQQVSRVRNTLRVIVEKAGSAKVNPKFNVKVPLELSEEEAVDILGSVAFKPSEDF